MLCSKALKEDDHLCLSHIACGHLPLKFKMTAIVTRDFRNLRIVPTIPYAASLSRRARVFLSAANKNSTIPEAIMDPLVTAPMTIEFVNSPLLKQHPTKLHMAIPKTEPRTVAIIRLDIADRYQMATRDGTRKAHINGVATPPDRPIESSEISAPINIVTNKKTH